MGKMFSVPRGTIDILPEQTYLWKKLEVTAARIIERYGYREIRTPLFEETELFAKCIGQTSDVVNKQMLNLAAQKQGCERTLKLSGLSLRPESTASIVRSYIKNNLDKKERLSKLYYIGPMFRGERPQRGRLRQFHQIGVEAIGPDSSVPYLDAEVIALAVHILEACGIRDFSLMINSLGSAEDKKRFSGILRRKIQPFLKDLCQDCQSRFERNVFRVLDCKNTRCRTVVRQITMNEDCLSDASRRYYADVCRALEDIGIPFKQDPFLVRGLDYYTHTVFEITSSGLGSQDALGAGGRYNHLVEQLGGPRIGAVGFALGIERMLLATGGQEDTPSRRTGAHIVVMDEQWFKDGFALLNRLRRDGIQTDMSFRTGSMKSLMRSADKNRARDVIILGEEELKKGTFSVKDMGTGVQSEMESYEKMKRHLERANHAENAHVR